MKIIHNLPFNQYLDLDALSNSGVGLMLKSPAHFRYSEDESSPALNLGRLVHKLVLEPDDFANEYKVADIDRRTKEGKAMAAKVEAEGLTAVSTKEFIKADEMRHSVVKHPEAFDLLTGGVSEVTVLREIDGVLMKGRVDHAHFERRILADLKTTSDASFSGFSRSVTTYGYHRQAAIYTDLVGEECRFVFVAVESAPPYAVATYELMPDLIEAGRQAYRSVLPVYRLCKDMDEWPAYPQVTRFIDAPNWLR